MQYFRVILAEPCFPPLVLHWGNDKEVADKIADFAGATVEGQRNALAPWEAVTCS